MSVALFEIGLLCTSHYLHALLIRKAEQRGFIGLRLSVVSKKAAGNPNSLCSKRSSCYVTKQYLPFDATQQVV